MNCINRNTTEYKQLLDETKLHPFVLDVKIAKWQDNNSVESFPTVSEINIPSYKNFNKGSEYKFNSETINKITSFLDNINVDINLKSSITNLEGNVVENALAAANFIEGTVEILNDLDKRPKAWDSLPEEAAHFWYEMLTDSKLKNELREFVTKDKDSYGAEFEKLKNLGYESNEIYKEIVAKAIANEINKQEMSPEFKSLWDNIVEFIKNFINQFKKNQEELETSPISVAAERILNSDLSDLLSVEELKELYSQYLPTTEVEVENKQIISTPKESIQIEDTQWYENLSKRFKVRSKLMPKTIEKLKKEIDAVLKIKPLNKESLTEKQIKQLETVNDYKTIVPELRSYSALRKKYQNGISLKSPIKLDVKKEDLEILNEVRELLLSELPSSIKMISPNDLIRETQTYLSEIYKLGFAEERAHLYYRIPQTFKHLNTLSSTVHHSTWEMMPTEEEIQRMTPEELRTLAEEIGINQSEDFSEIKHRKISLRFNNQYLTKASHFNLSPSAWGNITYFKTDSKSPKNAVLLHEFQNDFFEEIHKAKTSENAIFLSAAIKHYKFPSIFRALNSETTYSEFKERIQEAIELISPKSDPNLFDKKIDHFNEILDKVYNQKRTVESLFRKISNDNVLENSEELFLELTNSSMKSSYVNDPSFYHATLLRNLHPDLKEFRYKIKLPGLYLVSRNKLKSPKQLGFLIKKSILSGFEKEIQNHKSNRQEIFNQLSKLKSLKKFDQISKEKYYELLKNFNLNADLIRKEIKVDDVFTKSSPNVKIEKNYLTPLIHQLIQTVIKEKGKNFPIYFSGKEITLLTQGNEKTSDIYAGPHEVEKGLAKKPGALYIAMSKIPNIKLEYVENIPGFIKNVGGYKLDVSNYDYSTPLLFNRESSEIQEKSFEEKMNDLANPNAENILEINELEEVENQEEVDYGSSNNEVLFANTKKGVYEANEILQNIIDNNVEAITEQGKFFLDKAQKLLGKTGAKVRMRSEKSMRLNGSKDTIMMYESKTNTIYVSEEILSRITPELAVEAFLHEVTHAATVRAYFEAKTFAEIELKKFIDAAYEKYKNLASLTDSNGKEYGFTNQAEFIAEIFTNSEFQDVLRGLDPENQVVEPGFWSKLIDAIRRLFGLAKNEINTDFIDTSLVIKKVEELIETSDPKWKGTIRENPKYNMFEKQEAAKQETYRDYAKLETFEERLQYRVDQIKDNIDQNLGKYEKIKSKMKKGDERVKKLKRYTDVLDKLKTELESYDSSENWRAISAYVKNLIGGIESLDAKFAREDFKNKDIVHTIKMYSQYLDSYSLIEDVQELIADSKQEDGDVGITVEEQNEIENILVNASGKYVQLRKNFHAFVKKGMKQDLNKIKYHPEVETQWKDKLSKEYDENKEILGITEPKTSWISKQMNTTYKKDVQKDVDSATNKLIEGIGYDITKGTYYFSSGLNTNSKLVQIFQFMLDEIRRKIIDAVTTKDVQFKKMFEKLSKEKGSTDVLKLYKNIIEFDGDTPILKSDYSVKYKQKYNEFLEKLDKLEKEKGVKSKEYKDTKDKLNKLNKKDFKNDFSNLTKTELEVLNFFKEIIDESSKKTYNIRSLKKFEHGVFYYHLPVVTKTDLERLLSGDVKGTIKDKWKDLTEIRPDEEGFEYSNTQNIDIAGNPLYNIRILYRGNIPGKDQSLDLFTIMRMEYLNAVNFEVKTEKELELSSLVDIAKEKNYYRTEGFRNRVLSRFAKRNRASVIKGEESNTHKKLQSMIESNIYNMMTHKAGKIFGKVDTNKAVGFVTSWLAHAGLDMNRHAATANVINAQANMFLETIGKEVISTRNLRRANALYGNDMGNILKDITNAIPKSFTNQVSIMFDTFGYRDIGANSFIRTGIGKSLINTDRGQVMHNTGEHWVQSTLTMAILDGIKVMNANSDFINKEGKVVKTEKEAASLLDMLGLDNPDKKLELNPQVVYTTHTLNVKFEEGGREQIAELVKKKIFNSMGNYDPNMQPEAMRHWQGKLLMTFRRFFVPMLTYRYKGMEFSLKSKEELAKEPEKYLSYSHAMKQYEEGIYTTTVRFIANSIIPSIKKGQFQAISKDFSNLTEYEKANIKRTIVEFSLTMLILPIIRMLLSMMIGAASDDRDHWTNKQVFFWLYQTRRLESELSQFRNLSENFKILKNPIPAARLLEQGSELLIKMVNPFEWGELGDRYESGRKKGDLKIRHDFQKLIPILNKFNVNSEDLFNFQHSKFGQ